MEDVLFYALHRFHRFISLRRVLARIVAGILLVICVGGAVVALEYKGENPSRSPALRDLEKPIGKHAYEGLVLQSAPTDCAQATIYNYSILIGRHDLAASLRVDTLYSAFGTPPSALINTLASNGLKVHEIVQTGLRNPLRVPSIALIRRHYVLLTGIQMGGDAVAFDPAIGFVVIDSSRVSGESIVLIY